MDLFVELNTIIQSITPLHMVIAAWLLPFFGLMTLVKWLDPDNLYDPGTILACLIPAYNLFAFIYISFNVYKDKAVRERAAARKREEEKLIRVNVFLRQHGYTWEDVDDLYDSMSLLDKIIENNNGG